MKAQPTHIATSPAKNKPNPNPATRYAWMLGDIKLGVVELDDGVAPCWARQALAEEMTSAARYASTEYGEQGKAHHALLGRGWVDRLPPEYRDLVSALIKCEVAQARERIDNQEHALGLAARDWSGAKDCDIELTGAERAALDAHEAEMEARLAMPPEEMKAEQAAPPSSPPRRALTDAELLERAVRAAHIGRWSARREYHVMQAFTFAFDSGSAAALCQRFGLDPDEMVGNEHGDDCAGEE
jgi:hypothetical protein